jgi:glycosyltransferase involved in cell wall biosynthesis
MTQNPGGRKFKVCIVSISLGKGGAERSCAMLSVMLSRLGHDVHIAILNDEVDYDFEGTLFSLGRSKKQNETGVQRYLRFRKFRKYLLNEKFDVVIDHRPKNRYFREIFYHRYLYKNIPRIYVAHSSHKESYTTDRPLKIAKIYNENVANVAVSEYIENQVLKTCGIEKTTTIYNAYDETWDDQVENLPKDLKKANYILSYGRIDDSIKDFSFLIDSFNESKLWEEGIKLVILGDGKDKEMLQKYSASLESVGHIKFYPFTSAPFAMIKNARFVTLTSKYEGFPMVLVESLSLGTPVVSLDIKSGPNEIIKHQINGILVKARNVEHFADAMRSMFHNESLYEDCKKNAKKSVESFSMNEIALYWHKLLNDAL